MTSRALAIFNPSPAREFGVGRGSPRRRAFTLTEMLVVVAIIALLAAILTPVLFTANKKAYNYRVVSDLNAISVALHAYHSDFGDYPRVDYPGYPGTAAQVLAKALLGSGRSTTPAYNTAASYQPGDTVSQSGAFYMAQVRCSGVAPSATAPEWMQLPFDPRDGEDGYGFRIRATGSKTPVRGPYLNPDNFKVGKQMMILDYGGNPILYFPAKSGRTPDISVSDKSAALVQPDPRSDKTVPIGDQGVGGRKFGYVSLGSSGLYDAQSNLWAFAKAQDSSLLAGYPYASASAWAGSFDGKLDAGKVVARVAAPSTTFVTDADLRDYIQYRLEKTSNYAGPFLLWAPGRNGMYFDPDDVTNFGTP